jgi:hypothetical protein
LIDLETGNETPIPDDVNKSGFFIFLLIVIPFWKNIKGMMPTLLIIG